MINLIAQILAIYNFWLFLYEAASGFPLTRKAYSVFRSAFDKEYRDKYYGRVE